jgi:hypothetical protein
MQFLLECHCRCLEELASVVISKGEAGGKLAGESAENNTTEEAGEERIKVTGEKVDVRRITRF